MATDKSKEIAKIQKQMHAISERIEQIERDPAPCRAQKCARQEGLIAALNNLKRVLHELEHGETEGWTSRSWKALHSQMMRC